MPPFKNGTYVNKCNDDGRKYLRISAGPQRGRYVHDIILEAIIQRDLKPGETAEHVNGDGLNVHHSNIGRKPVFRRENTKLMHQRKKREAKKKALEGGGRWQSTTPRTRSQQRSGATLVAG